MHINIMVWCMNKIPFNRNNNTMRVRRTNPRRDSMLLQWLGAWVVFGAMWICSAQAAQTVSVITQITLAADPPGLQVQLDGPAAYRALLVEPREVMIAFKGARVSEKLNEMGAGGELIRQVKIDRLPQEVVALLVTTGGDVKDIRTTWDSPSHTLRVTLVFEAKASAVPHKEKKSEFRKNRVLLSRQTAGAGLAQAPGKVSAPPPEQLPERAPEPEFEQAPEPAPAVATQTEPQNQPETAPAPAPVTSFMGELEKDRVVPLDAMTGSTDDLLLLLGADACREQADIEEALRQCRRKNWRKAFNGLNEMVIVGGEVCLEQAYYLRGYAYYKLNRRESEVLYLEAVSYLQDAISYYPDSRLAPYAMASMGKIYKALKNYAEAKGYFKIILEKNKSYYGRPEVMKELAEIYAMEKNLKPCISIYKKFLTLYPNNQFALDVKQGLGQALYQSNRYSDALDMLNDVLEADPRRAFESEGLLLAAGNCYYQLGQFTEARNALTQSFNFFPDAEANPISLTRIGDTYRDTNKPERAKKIYQVVMDRFPGSDGYLISAMRQADLLEDSVEKETIYRMIMDEYPDHPMTNLAVVKLSDLQYKAGEYRKSLETIRPLVLARPKGLISEAVFIMQSSFQGLLSDLLEADAYPEMVAFHKKEQRFLRRMDAPDIFSMLGTAYLRGHLYKEAATLLQRGEMLAGRNMPADFFYNLGVALQESGQLAPAEEKFRRYIKKEPGGPHASQAYFRVGLILMDSGDYPNALTALKRAYRLSVEIPRKAEISLTMAEAYLGLGNLKQSTGSLIQTVNFLAESSGENTGPLADAYLRLGQNYMQMKLYKGAADAFTMALKFSGNVAPPDALLQLGEAYRKAGERDQAIKVFDQVANAADEFWQKLAQERLNRMSIQEKIRTDGV